MHQKTLIILLLVTLIVAGPVEKRKSFSVPLPFLTLSLHATGSLEEVFVTFGSIHEGWGISGGDDRYVKDTQKERLDHFFREIPQQAYMLSPFEAELLNKVCSAFAQTLDVFDRDLQARNWDRVLYLDGHFTQFFKGFYSLMQAARNSRTMLSPVVDIPDTLFDLSMESPKTDARINQWRKNPDQLMKLRIAAKELSFQIRQWQKKELANKRRDAWEDNSKQFTETYELFIRLYFNMPAKKI